MFNAAITVLREKYSFNSFKALGHSNGGLIYTVFLQQYLANHSGLEMEKLLTIGSPYNLNKKRNQSSSYDVGRLSSQSGKTA